MNPDLAAILAEARKIKQEYPDATRKEIDEWVQQAAPNVPSFAALEQMVQPTRAPTKDGPGMLSRVLDAARKGPSDFVTQANATVGAGANPAGAQFATGQNERLSQNFARSALRGATFNLDRPIAGALGIDGGLYSPEAQQSFSEYQQNHPGMDLVGNIAGGIPSGGLLGKAARAALLPRASTVLSKGAPLSSSVARVLTAEGTAPRMIQGALSGGAAAGVSAAADGRSAGETAVATVLGGGMGAAIPGLLSAAMNRGGLGAEAIAARRLRNRAEMLGNVAEPGANGAIVNDVPLGLGDRVRDALDPARRVERVSRGVARLNAERAASEATGRTGRTVLDYEPYGTNNVLRTEAANAIRSNPEAAAQAGVVNLANRNEGLAASMIRDVNDVSPIPMRGAGNIALSRQGRAERLARVLERKAGQPARIISPTTINSTVPSRVGFNPDARKAEIAANLKAFAASEEGYGGLSPVIQSGSGGVGTSPEVLDRARYALAQDVEGVVDDGVRKFLAQTNQDLGRLQGGVTENVVTYMEDVQSTLQQMNAFIDEAKKGATVSGIYISKPKLRQIEEARDLVIKYADDGFRGVKGQTFSDVSREYAVASDAIRKIDEGRQLVRGTVPGKANASPELSRQLIQKAPPAVRDEYAVGALGQVLEDLRAATNTEAGGLVKNFTQKARDTYRQNVVLRELFPTQGVFERAAHIQALNDAADAGAEAFTTTSAAELNTMLNNVGGAQQKRQFQRYLFGQYVDRLQTSDGAQAIVSQFTEASGRVPTSGPQWEKLRVMFGPDGAQQMRGRLMLAAREMQASKVIGDASRDVSSAQLGGVSRALTSGNARGVVMSGVGALRKLGGLELSTQAKNRVASILTRPDGLRQFSDIVGQSAAPTAIGPQTGLLLPALAGYQAGQRRQ